MGDDCIYCFYHGWKYDLSGQCVEQPGEDAAFTSKIKIRSYSTEEYLGLIFAFLGDGAAPPLPRYSDLDASAIVDVLLSEEWPCNYFNRLDIWAIRFMCRLRIGSRAAGSVSMWSFLTNSLRRKTMSALSSRDFVKIRRDLTYKMFLFKALLIGLRKSSKKVFP